MYELKSPIGEGVTGKVSVYRNIFDGMLYALKEMDQSFMTVYEKERVFKEIEILIASQSPMIVEFYSFFTEGKMIYIVMEYAAQGDLESLIQEKI